jgi:hypothetical protein
MRLRLPVVGRLLDDRARRRCEDEYRAAIESARRAGDSARLVELQQEKHWNDEIEHDERELACTQSLTREAHQLRVPLPARPPYSDDPEDNEFWSWSRVYGQHYLSPTGYSTLRDSIRREREAQRGERNHLLQWIAAVTGLIGALTGLGAILIPR